jgi:hypothetical protein
MQAGERHNISNTQDDLSSSLELDSREYFPLYAAELDWEYWQNLLDGRGDPLFDGHEQRPW